MCGQRRGRCANSLTEVAPKSSLNFFASWQMRACPGTCGVGLRRIDLVGSLLSYPLDPELRNGVCAPGIFAGLPGGASCC